MGIPVAGRDDNAIALEVADKAIAEFGQQKGELMYLKRAPKKRYELWQELGIAPRGIDREVVEVMHRTHMGDDQDAEHILDQALRCALSDGWGGSMIATDLSDVLFGTPSPLVSQVNLGVIKDDEVNIVVHGHEPTLSEMLVAAVNDPELIAYAKTKGAKGHQHGGHLLHLQRDPDAPGHAVSRQLPAPGIGDYDWGGGGHGGGCPVHHAGAAQPGRQLPHGDHHHLAQGQDHRGGSHPL